MSDILDMSLVPYMPCGWFGNETHFTFTQTVLLTTLRILSVYDNPNASCTYTIFEKRKEVLHNEDSQLTG